MPLPVENCSSDLINLLKDRFDIADSVDEAGHFTDDPSEIKVFSFNFVTKKGEDKGSVVISILDDSESSNAIKIYFGQDLANSDSDTRTEWYAFLQSIRQFAKMHLMGFDVQNINKSQITRRDVEKDLKLIKEDLEPMFEGTFGPIDGTVKTSHQTLSDAPIRLVIKHTSKIDPDIRGGRSRRIQKIYLINGNNERFLLPFKNLVAARAMARHIETGGTPYDEVGRNICQLVEEMVSLNKFYRKQKNSDAASKPYVSSILAATRERYLDIKKTLASMSTKGGYAKNISVLGGNIGELEDDDEMMEDIFDGSKMDEESQLALPHVMRAYRTHGKTDEQDEFDKWVNAAKGQGEGQEIIMDNGVEDDGSAEGLEPEMLESESQEQKEEGKRAGQRDLQMIKKAEEDAESGMPYEYGGMHGSIPSRDAASGEGGMSYLESINHFKKIVEGISEPIAKKQVLKMMPDAFIRQDENGLYNIGYEKENEDKENVNDFAHGQDSIFVKLNPIPKESPDEAWDAALKYLNFKMIRKLGESIPDREDNDLRNEWTPCEEYGHRFQIGDDPEIYSTCIDCGEPNTDEELMSDMSDEHQDERNWVTGDMNESVINELFGFNREADAKTDKLIMKKLLNDLDFEPIVEQPDNEIWKKSYFSVIFGLAKNKKLGWVITRNGQFTDKGFGAKSFFEALFMHYEEFRGELHRIYTKNNPKEVQESKGIIDDLLRDSGLLEADVPTSSSWNGPLTWVNTSLGSKFRKPAEIKKHQNTTGKLSPFSLLSTPERDVDDAGKEVPRATSRGVRSISLPSNQSGSGSNSMSQW